MDSYTVYDNNTWQMKNNHYSVKQTGSKGWAVKVGL